ncbi:MAG: hypothetical protein LH603_02800 [Pseudonocardia sp.]|nr:hypothetical protein [Pseudonocardia sp.]
MEYRDQVHMQRASRAATMATDLIADLAQAVAEQPDIVVTDALCERLGALLADDERSPGDVRIDPHHLAEAALVAAEASVVAALTATVEQADAWRGPWRVLTAVTAVLPHPFHDAVDETITRLRALPAGRMLPKVPRGPTVTGQVLWTADRYGSRFAFTAAIMTAEEAVRWYLWDIDACGHEAFTVHSGYYPSSAAALTSWQNGVGPTSSAGTVLAPVDDPGLLADLLPVEAGFMRPGGENVEQFAEYHRSKRLAEAVKRAGPRPEARSDSGLTAATAAVEFAAWLRAHESGQPEPTQDLDELVEELADSWNLNGIDAVYATCSPHRVALCALHMRNYYLHDYADQLMALLPEWVRWLAARNTSEPELIDRCLPYALGRPHPQLGDDDTKVDYLARIIE